jgi:predicted cupin superfamily sugar epimerase
MVGKPELAALLDLETHPEGGWYRQTWRSDVEFVPPGYPGVRAAATGIYFLLDPGEVSRWHVVRSDEVWFWHRGGPLLLRTAQATPSAAGTDAPGPDVTEIVLGPDVAAGQAPQVLIPAGTWQSAEPVPGAGEEPALVSCVVAPGFEYEDWRLALPAQ